MKIIIIDPIFKASRLYISMLNINALQNENTDVKVLTQINYKSELLEDNYLLNNIVIHPIVNLPKDFWYDRMTYRNINTIINKLESILKKSENNKIIFTGYNEFHPIILFFFFRIKKISLHNKIYFMDYDSTYLLKETSLSYLKKIKGFIKKAITYLFATKDIKYIVFDERLSDEKMTTSYFEKIAKPYYKLICDPCPDFQKAIINKLPTYTTSNINILIVGTQTKRKGFSEILKYLEDTPKNKIKFYLKGRLEKDFLLQKSYPNLSIEEKFFSEEELRVNFYSTDYVILPYSKEFYASSGVLAYATTYGKPIISTNHGLIGYRVNHFLLGYTYDYNNIEELSNILNTLPDRNSDEYKIFQKNCEEFSKNITEQKYRKILNNIVKDDV